MGPTVTRPLAEILHDNRLYILLDYDPRRGVREGRGYKPLKEARQSLSLRKTAIQGIESGGNSQQGRW